MEDGKYIGNELEVFENANVWKRYYGNIVKPYIHSKVLEVGAGIGGTTTALCLPTHKDWICLETDKAFFEIISEKIAQGKLPAICRPFHGTIDELPQGETFDSIIYMDVLEHIEDDREEVLRATARLKPGGYLVVLVPAHNWLFSPFDKAIGHYRRYNKKMLTSLNNPEIKIEKFAYLDSVGLLASCMNKLFLKQSQPKLKQILFWDRFMVPFSKILDPLTMHSLGKSALIIWKKN